MDKETARYIRIYFPNLLTDKEKMAIRHSNSIEKLNSFEKEDIETRIRLFKKKDWLTEDQEVLDLLKDGFDLFEQKTAQRILQENFNKLFLNNCPKCGRLARTPQARQCRFCGFDWHNITAAQFKLNGAFELTGRCFYLLGEITKGQVEIGNYVDLTMVGLNCKPKIESIEFALKRVNSEATENFGLGIIELTNEQKLYLKKLGSFGTPFDIIKEK